MTRRRLGDKHVEQRDQQGTGSAAAKTGGGSGTRLGRGYGSDLTKLGDKDEAFSLLNRAYDQLNNVAGEPESGSAA